MKYAKRLGLVVAAVMAFAAFTGVASASAAEFHASGPVGTPLTGVQIEGGHVFETQGQKVTCETARFEGKVEALTSTTQKVHPVYEDCTAFGFVGAEVNTKGCEYTFHSGTTPGTVDLSDCDSGAVTITIDLSILAKCVVEVPDQNGINGQTFTTEGNSPDRRIVVDTDSTNITSNVVTSAGLCPLTVENGAVSTYTGQTTVTPGEGEIWFE